MSADDDAAAARARDMRDMAAASVILHGTLMPDARDLVSRYGQADAWVLLGRHFADAYRQDLRTLAELLACTLVQVVTPEGEGVRPAFEEYKPSDALIDRAHRRQRAAAAEARPNNPIDDGPTTT